jgi:hypothetical protein
MDDLAPIPIDRSVLMARLATLNGEYTSGRRMLADLESRATALREQLLRIGGAVQVLEELLQTTESATDEAEPGRAAVTP